MEGRSHRYVELPATAKSSDLYVSHDRSYCHSLTEAAFGRLLNNRIHDKIRIKTSSYDRSNYERLMEKFYEQKRTETTITPLLFVCFFVCVRCLYTGDAATSFLFFFFSVSHRLLIYSVAPLPKASSPRPLILAPAVRPNSALNGKLAAFLDGDLRKHS